MRVDGLVSLVTSSGSMVRISTNLVLERMLLDIPISTGVVSILIYNHVSSYSRSKGIFIGMRIVCSLIEGVEDRSEKVQIEVGVHADVGGIEHDLVTNVLIEGIIRMVV